MFSIKIDKNIIKNVTEIDINLLIPHEKVLVDKKEILKNNLKYKDDYIIISSIIICNESKLMVITGILQ
jgi:phage pi2 protein 07